MSSFSVLPAGLVSSDCEPVVGIQVRFLDAGYINVVGIQSFSERKLFVVHSFRIPLENVQRSRSLLRVCCSSLASSIYPPPPWPGSSQWDGVTSGSSGWTPSRHGVRHSTSPGGLHRQSTITQIVVVVHHGSGKRCTVVMRTLAQCIRLQQWFLLRLFLVVGDLPAMAVERPLPLVFLSELSFSYLLASRRGG